VIEIQIDAMLVMRKSEFYWDRLNKISGRGIKTVLLTNIVVNIYLDNTTFTKFVQHMKLFIELLFFAFEVRGEGFSSVEPL